MQQYRGDSGERNNQKKNTLAKYPRDGSQKKFLQNFETATS